MRTPLVNYAQTNNMLVRGHTMVWHSQAGSLQGANQSTLNTFIGNALTRWGNKIAYWDVVNEAMADDNTGRRRTEWPHTLNRDANGDGDFFDSGDTDVIRDSFTRAKQVVQANGLTTKLCINDYDVEGLTVQGGTANRKANALYDIVRNYRQYIDCVGFQSHFNDNPNSIISNDLQANIQRFADLGVEVHITELDIDDDLSNNDIGQGQAENYRKVVRACLNVAKCTGITVWGISDSESWRVLRAGPAVHRQQRQLSEEGRLHRGAGGAEQGPPELAVQPAAVQPAAVEPAAVDPPRPARLPLPRRRRARPRRPARPRFPPVARRRSRSTPGTADSSPRCGSPPAPRRSTAGRSALTLPSGAAVSNSWSASASGTSGAVRFTNVNYNGTSPPDSPPSSDSRAPVRPPASPPPAPPPELIRTPGPPSNGAAPGHCDVWVLANAGMPGPRPQGDVTYSIGLGGLAVPPGVALAASAADEHLWPLITAGHHGAFTILYERHAEAVWNYAYRLTASWSEADDLLSVVFLTAWRRRRDLRLVHGSALPWLYVVTTNVSR